MDKFDSIEDFYKNQSLGIPDDYKKEIGHFNVFRLDPYVGKNAIPIPHKRRDYYKIMLVVGPSRVHYADKTIEVKKQALSFSNPQIPYKWEHFDTVRTGYFCIFNQYFFHQFGNLSEYEVFQPNGAHVFELTDEQVLKITDVFNRMFEEINSDYAHKYDVLRNLVFEILHFAIKMQPALTIEKQQINASTRISTLFLELLERQFPIDDLHEIVNLRTASDFANQLNVHVNHLNRAVKETTLKTTTQIIADRILQESKILLKHSNKNVSEIAYALGFSEVTHFNNFFKKYVEISPLKYRNV